VEADVTILSTSDESSAIGSEGECVQRSEVTANPAELFGVKFMEEASLELTGRTGRRGDRRGVLASPDGDMIEQGRNCSSIARSLRLIRA